VGTFDKMISKEIDKLIEGGNQPDEIITVDGYHWIECPKCEKMFIADLSGYSPPAKGYCTYCGHRECVILKEIVIHG